MFPFELIGTDGSVWRYEENGCRESFLAAIEDQLAKNTWTLAEGHIDGMGLRDGPDLAIYTRCFRKLRKMGDIQGAGLLMTIAAGGLWPQKRKYEAGLVEFPTCPVCGEVDQDVNLHVLGLLSNVCMHCF